MSRHQLSGASYGHFGEGCMHMRMDFDVLSPAGVHAYRSFVEEATDLVVTLGGSVSGEHGDGRARSELLARMYGGDVSDLFTEMKRIWDPTGVMNPGVIALPEALDSNMRNLGPAKERRLLTHPRGRRGLRPGATTMRRRGQVPAIHRWGDVPRLPGHSRGEALHPGASAPAVGDAAGRRDHEGMRSTEVRDALDLCLSCKGCLSDCPVNVDMATYKAVFLHHHYRRRLRPLSHYSMGWLPMW
jgi:hypothetical protein